MREAVSRLRSHCQEETGPDQRMMVYLASRRIAKVRLVEQQDADGRLEPVGNRYIDGFTLLLASKSAYTRLRFTLAHEICHTFFYEYVPEIKFFPHEVDAMEERLCDLGAAELLMPSCAVKRAAGSHPVCIQSLRMLASQFSVSVSAMFLQLRLLDLWRCVLAEWHRMSNGSFQLANLYGGKRLPWEWDDPSILPEAWNSYKSSFGHTFVRYELEQGRRFYSPARFEVQRIGNRIFSLWGAEIERPRYPSSLFQEFAA